MSWHPTFNLYQSNGSTLAYAFQYIQDTNYPQDAPDNVQLTSLRGQGAIVIPGGDKPWTIELKGILLGTDYTDLTSQMSTLRAIAANTHYVLKIDTSSSTTENFNVMRVSSIDFESGRRTKIQRYNIKFLVNSW